MLPSLRASAWRMTLRSARSRALLRLSTSGSSSPPACRSRSAAVTSLPSAMIAARFTRFSSSRTLPGQFHASIAASASGANPVTCGFISREALQECLGEQRRVAGPLGQRRNPDDDFGQAIEQVLAEAPVTDHRLEVLVCRADDARVYVDRLAPADPLDLPFLQEAEQLDLQRQRDVAYLVEEQRAAAR